MTECFLVCDKCNYNCKRTETLAKHMNTNHEINKIYSCEYCKIYHISENDQKDHMELHKQEENGQHSSQGCSNKSSEKPDQAPYSDNSFETQNGAFEEMKRRDIKNHNKIEKVLEECRKDLLDDNEDDEVFSESESQDWGTYCNWQHLLLCKWPSIGRAAELHRMYTL